LSAEGTGFKTEKIFKNSHPLVDGGNLKIILCSLSWEWVSSSLFRAEEDEDVEEEAFRLTSVTPSPVHIGTLTVK